MLNNQQKLSDWNVCRSKKLIGIKYLIIGFKEKNFINFICKVYYGSNGLDSCIKRQNFCTKCCRFNIGLNHNKVFKRCTNSCEARINSKSKNQPKDLNVKEIKKNNNKKKE